MLTVCCDVFLQEFSTNRLSRHHVVVTVVTTPLRKVIRNIKCRGRGRGILIVDKVDLFNAVLRCGGTVLSWEDDDIRTKKVAVAEDQLCLLARVYQESRGVNTPPWPIPVPSSSSATIFSNSVCKLRLRRRCSSFWVGKARIHRWITVQMFVPGCLGWIGTISSALLGSCSSCESTSSGREGSPVSVEVDEGASLIGRTACHWPSRLAIPRQTAGFTKSVGAATRPRRNRYNRPFWKRARSGGARPRLARRAWELVSPIHDEVLLSSLSHWAGRA